MARTTRSGGNGSSIPIEQQLWQAADILRGHMDAAWLSASSANTAIHQTPKNLLSKPS